MYETLTDSLAVKQNLHYRLHVWDSLNSRKVKIDLFLNEKKRL